jgi:transposase
VVKTLFNRNQDIKKAKKDVPDYAIAEKLKISENTFYRWIRKELPDEKKEIIMQAILGLKKELDDSH